MAWGPKTRRRRTSSRYEGLRRPSRWSTRSARPPRAPPEDCSGVPGYYAALEVLADPNHPDHAELADWFDDYDPKTLDDLPLEVAVGRIASRRRAGKIRKRKPEER